MSAGSSVDARVQQKKKTPISRKSGYGEQWIPIRIRDAQKAILYLYRTAHISSPLPDLQLPSRSAVVRSCVPEIR